MTFGNDGFDGNVLVVDYEERILMENVRRHILNNLSTFCYSKLNLAKGWKLFFFGRFWGCLGRMPTITYYVFSNFNLLSATYQSSDIRYV
jgi:hypothetical protein